jgi:DNA-binding PadR family transcriptional regulator
MGKSNTTLFAVLGVLSQGDCTGYEIKKRFDGSLRHFWSESFGQIYPVLKQLVKQEYAEEIPFPDRTRGQKKFRITPLGLDYFREWLSNPARAVNYRDELLLKMYFATSKDTDAVQALLEKERDEFAAMHQIYLEQSNLLDKHKEDEEYPYWMLTLRYGILSSKARMDWCTESLETLKRLKGKGGSSHE